MLEKQQPIVALDRKRQKLRYLSLPLPFSYPYLINFRR